jgi:hypothetical protein
MTHPGRDSAGVGMFPHPYGRGSRPSHLAVFFLAGSEGLGHRPYQDEPRQPARGQARQPGPGQPALARDRYIEQTFSFICMRTPGVRPGTLS